MKDFFRQYFSKQFLLSYLYEILTGRLLGFIVGMWTSGLVSRFFDTPRFRNLWGLTAKKTVVSKATYENLEWIASVVIGFVVFEIVHRTMKDHVLRHWPEYYRKGKSYLDEKGYTEKARTMRMQAMQQLMERTGKGKEKAKEIYEKYLKK